MIGDLIINIKRALKQCFCTHEYDVVTRNIGLQTFNIYTCKKCGRVKSKKI